MQLPSRGWKTTSDRISSRLLQTGDLILHTTHRLITPAPTLQIDNNNNYSINNKPKEPAEIRRDRSIPSREGRRQMVFVVLLMVVALAVVGTKRLAFGITLSAFSLLVLEYVGCYYRLWMIFQSALRFEDNQNKLFEAIDDDDDDESSLQSALIEIVNEVGSCRHISGHVDDVLNEEYVNVNDARAVGISGTEKKRLRRAVLKSKIIRRLVPKKFRGTKYCKGSEGKFEDHAVSVKVKDGDCGVGNLTIRQVISEVEPEGEECEYFHFGFRNARVGERKLSGDLSWSSDQSLNSEADCVSIGSSDSNELVKRSGTPKKLVLSDIQIDARGNSCYIMLVVIVLAGLVGGRILSFLLAICYCCIVKYVCTLRRDSAKPTVTSSVHI